MIAYAVIKNPIFESITIFVIVSNSVILALADPTQTETPPFFDVLNNIYLVLYSTEMVLKVMILHNFLDLGLRIHF